MKMGLKYKLIQLGSPYWREHFVNLVCVFSAYWKLNISLKGNN